MPPAARMGDPTAHGGVVALGFPMVLIGGQPAARMGDMHVCPMVTPGVPPIPHVGGPVMMGFPLVLIGGQPAARMGDVLMCVGPPDTIAMGCPTVLIGDGGGGGGGASSSGGGGIGSAASGAVKAKGGASGAGSLRASTISQISGPSGVAALAASALMAQSGSQESDTKWQHWVEFQFVDKAGNPVSGLPYEFIGSDGKKTQSVLQSHGKIRRDGLSPGPCKVRLFNIFNARWGKATAKVGETVRLSADVEGFKDNEQGTFQIYKRDFSQPDIRIAELSATVRSNKLETDWQYPGPPKGKSDKASSPAAGGYNAPEFYFDAVVGPCRARSSSLYVEDYIELSVKDEKGKPLANEEYVLHLPDGSVRKGNLDGQGHMKEEKVPAGQYTVQFPNLPRPEK